jgi:membrane-bound metal-dependent hydrolase YbcI (DUF457 family)
MTTFEHVMLGVTGSLALGVHRPFGWKIVAMAGVTAAVPDWDGLTILGGMEVFDRAHRAWGHNLLIAALVGCLCGVLDYRFDLVGRGRRFGQRFVVHQDDATPLRAARNRSAWGYVVWLLVGSLAAVAHLAADLVVSGAAGLSDWELPLLWPFSRQGFVYPLVPWGDPGASLIFVGGMFAMVRWPSRLQIVAVTTLFAVVAYIVLRGIVAGRF